MRVSRETVNRLIKESESVTYHLDKYLDFLYTKLVDKPETEKFYTDRLGKAFNTLRESMNKAKLS